MGRPLHRPASSLFVIWIAYQGPTWFNLQSRGLAQWISPVVGRLLAGRNHRRRRLGRTPVAASRAGSPAFQRYRMTGSAHDPWGIERLAIRVRHAWPALPGNQVLDIRAHHKVLLHRNLPRSLDRLRIAQVTDLHMMGHFTLEFYQAAIERVNAWHPDVVMITGDLVDNPDCIAWIPETLGRLRSSVRHVRHPG